MKVHTRSFLALLAVLGLLLVTTSRAAEAPRVVVTIKPVHSLVAGVMAGVGVPDLLIQGSASPHTFTLHPSGARMLAQADLIVRVGADFETFLTRPLANLAKDAELLSLDQAPGITLLAAREGGVWEAHQHSAEVNSGHDHAETNLHLWLDPQNARAIVAAVAEKLAALDPLRAARYRSNAKNLDQRLVDLDARLREDLRPVAGLPYVVFHDAYPYLEHRYGLTPLGSITVSPDRPPGARRLTEIRDKIIQTGARCVFTEPQFEPKLAILLTEGTGARSGILDPEGAALTPGPDAYFQLLENLAGGLRGCLLGTAQGKPVGKHHR